MPTIGSITKTVRINAEDLAVIEEIMAIEKVTWSGAIHFLANNRGTPSEKNKKSGLTPNKDLEEIGSMAKFFGITTEALLRAVCDGLMDGALTVEGGKVVGTPDESLTRFKEACHDMGIDPEKALEKATLGVKRGQI